MIERAVFRQINRLQDPALRSLAERTARLVLDNWFYVLVVVFLFRYPYIVADWTDTEVMPRRPTGDSAFWQSEMARALTIACLAMSYNLLFGFSGIISFGHALFFGAGGYITFILLFNYDASMQTTGLGVIVAAALGLTIFSRLSTRAVIIFGLTGALLVLVLLPRGDDIGFYQAAGVAVLLSVMVSLISGVVTLRLRGIYFTMFTLALAEMFFVMAKSGTFRDYTGAEDGLGFRDVLPEALNPTQTFDGSRMDMYRVTVVFFVIVFLAIRRYLNSPVGHVMLAIRENEERARTIGYNTLYYKVLTMIFAGVIATMSGLLFVIWATDKRVHPEALSLKYTVDPLLHTLIGGVGTLTGPVVAALGLQLGETYLRNETFTAQTEILGPLTVWHIFTMILVGIVFWLARRPLRQGAERLVAGREPARTWRQAVFAGLFAVSVLIGLLVVGQLISGSELETEVYEVSDLWDLFLGLVFVVVVMVLPQGIVGTWNRLMAERRIRRLERELAQQRAEQRDQSPLHQPVPGQD